MKEINLRCGRISQVDNKNFEWLNQWKWYALKDKYTYYACRSVYLKGKTKRIFMHRLILNVPVDKITDHRDGNGLHNCENNLRICTNQQNQFNQRPHKNTASVYKGVRRRENRNKWIAIISFNKKRIWLGSFISEIEAAQAYDAKAIELFGDFARINVYNNIGREFINAV